MNNKISTQDDSQFFDFERLPKDLLLKIFSHLFEEDGYIRLTADSQDNCRISRVNKKFRANLHGFFEKKVKIHCNINNLNSIKDRLTNNFETMPQLYFYLNKLAEKSYLIGEDSGDEGPTEEDMNITKVIYLARENDTESLLKIIRSHEDLGNIFKAFKSALVLFLLIAVREKNQAQLDTLYQQAQKFYQKNKRIDIGKKDSHRYTLLDWAIICRQSQQIISDLIHHGYPIDDPEVRCYMKPIYIASVFDDRETIEKLINLGAKIYTHSNTSPSILQALIGFSSQTAELLISRCPDLAATDYWGRSALHFSAEAQRYDICRFLVDRGVNVNQVDQSGETPLLDASTCKEMLKIKSISNVTLDDYFNKELSRSTSAIEDSTASVIQLLVERGANVNHANNLGDTALVKIAQTGHIDGAKLLIKHGADVNHIGRGGVTPLHHAIANNQCELVKILIDSGADVNHPIKIRVIPYQLENWENRQELEEILINLGADLNQKSTIEVTPLRLALECNIQKIVQVFNVFDRFDLNRDWQTLAQLLIESGAQETLSSNLSSKL